MRRLQRTVSRARQKCRPHPMMDRPRADNSSSALHPLSRRADGDGCSDVRVAVAGSGCHGCTSRGEHRRASLRSRAPAEMPTPTPRWTGPVGCACRRMPSNQHDRVRSLQAFAPRSCFHLASTARVHGSNFQDRLGEIDQVQRLTGAPEEIRTPDPQIRSLIVSTALIFLDFP